MPEDFNKKLKEWEQIKEGKPSPRSIGAYIYEELRIYEDIQEYNYMGIGGYNDCGVHECPKNIQDSQRKMV